jgi:putative membrane protein
MPEVFYRKECKMERYQREQIAHNTFLTHYALPGGEGAFAGLIATVPMTLFMLAAQRTLPHRQQYALPPEILTDKFARLVGLRKHMKKPHLLLASLVSHLSFGATAGAIYGPLTRIIPIPSVLKGIVFGLVVWVANYLGWIPVVGMAEAATRQPIQRNALMVAAHVVWGAGTGVLANGLDHKVGALLFRGR